MNRSPDAPHTYPRRALLCATGLSPQVVTETIYALAVQGRPRFVPTQLHLLTTDEGRRRAELSLLKGEAWLPRLCEEYALEPIGLPPENIHVIADGDGRPLPDIRTAGDNDQAADRIAAQVRALTADPDCALHVSIAGGRKTMGYYTGYALSLYGRPQDRLSHVLVSPPFESLQDFYYPARRQRVIHTRDNVPHDASAAAVTLASIPFVRLREGLPEALLSGEESFGAAVGAAQQAVGPAQLTIDLAGRRVAAGGRIVELPPRELAFYAWFARRRARRQEAVLCPSEGAPEAAHAEAFLVEYRATVGRMGDDERTAAALRAGMPCEYFSQVKSRLNSRLRNALGRTGAQSYLVVATGRRGQRRFGLDLPPENIQFKEDAARRGAQR